MKVRLVILAKAPVAGLAKTRLAPVIGLQGAASLALSLLQHTLQQAVAAQIGTVELCAEPALHPIMVREAQMHGVTLSAQVSGDLGQRMLAVTERVLSCDECLIMVGTDCPDLTPAHYQRAAQKLQTHDVVCFPATDGGYVLLGLRKPQPELFQAMPWSTANLLSASKVCLQKLGSTAWFGEMLNDIDEPEDLINLPATWRLPSVTEDTIS